MANDALSFQMGTYEAKFPIDRVYSKNHLWLKALAERPDQYRVGLTAYSVRLLRDVYFLDWSVDANTVVAAKQEIGQVESSKAVSSLYAPAAGRLLSFNEELLADPAGINVDHYGAGWLFELETSEPLLSPTEYIELLHSGWKDAQRLIKNQMNQG